MRIARVFPRRTAATPTDELVFIGSPPMLALPEIEEVHVSVTFTYDKKKAEALANEWKYVGVPVSIGGPAYDDPGGEFVPGMYIKPGYTMTSRGCNNNCWFCMVPKREGKLREIPIMARDNSPIKPYICRATSYPKTSPRWCPLRKANRPDPMRREDEDGD